MGEFEQKSTKEAKFVFNSLFFQKKVKMRDLENRGYQALVNEEQSHDDISGYSAENTDKNNTSFIETMKDITTVNRVVSLAARAVLFMIIIAIILIWGYTKIQK